MQQWVFGGAGVLMVFISYCLCSACWEREKWPLCSLSHKGFCGSACHTRRSSSTEGHLHLSTLCLSCEETSQICNLLSCLEKNQSLFMRNVESLRFRGINPHTDCHICSAPTSKDQIKLKSSDDLFALIQLKNDLLLYTDVTDGHYRKRQYRNVN